MNSLTRVGLCLVVLCGSVLCGSVSAATVFTFDSDPNGQSTAFTDTVGGLSVTFSSPNDPGGFSIGPSFFSTLTGQILADPGPANVNSIPLRLSFSSLLTDVSLLFATNSNGPVPITLMAYLGGTGGTLVGTSTVSGTIPNGFTFPEGSISFSGSVFDTIVLSSGAQDFAIDNVSATVVPEPGQLGMVALGLAALGWYRRRTRR